MRLSPPGPGILAVLFVALGTLSGCTTSEAPAPPAGEPAAAPASVSPADAEQAVRQIEAERTTALVNEDAEYVERVYADNYVVVGANGVIRDRAQVIDDMKTGAQTFDALTHDDVSVRVYGDTAIVTGRTTTKGQYKGQPQVSPTNFTRVYVRQEGQWRLVANHASSASQ